MDLAVCAALASSPHLARLTTLVLRGNWIGDRGARALASSPCLGRLSRIDLSANGINKAAKRLRQRFDDSVRLA